MRKSQFFNLKTLGLFSVTLLSSYLWSSDSPNPRGEMLRIATLLNTPFECPEGSRPISKKMPDASLLSYCLGKDKKRVGVEKTFRKIGGEKRVVHYIDHDNKADDIQVFYDRKGQAVKIKNLDQEYKFQYDTKGNVSNFVSQSTKSSSSKLDISGCEGGFLSDDQKTITCPNGNTYRLMESTNQVGRHHGKKSHPTDSMDVPPNPYGPRVIEK